jgi:proline iminopeptidase
MASVGVEGEQFEERVDVGGAELWCATTGSGPGVVLAHGGPGMSDNLRPVAAMFDDIATVHRFGQRACGGSTGRGVGQTVASGLADLDALRQHWGYEKWIVGGHSWGAALALFYALAHPIKTHAVLYICGPGIAPLTSKPVARSRRERLSPTERTEFASLEARAELGDAVAVRRLAHMFWQTDFSDVSKAPDFDVSPMFAYPRNKEAANALRNSAEKYLADDRLVAEVRKLNIPVLVLHGADDPLPVEGAIALAGLLPSAELVTIDAVGHTPWMEDPEAMRRALREFITEVCAESV